MNAQVLNSPPSVEYHYSEKNGVNIQLTQFGNPEDREWHLLLSVTDPSWIFSHNSNKCLTPIAQWSAKNMPSPASCAYFSATRPPQPMPWKSS